MDGGRGPRPPPSLRPCGRLPPDLVPTTILGPPHTAAQGDLEGSLGLLRDLELHGRDGLALGLLERDLDRHDVARTCLQQVTGPELRLRRARDAGPADVA